MSSPQIYDSLGTQIYQNYLLTNRTPKTSPIESSVARIYIRSLTNSSPFLLRHPYIAIGLGLFGVWENFNDVELDCEFEGELEQDRARCARRRRRRRGRARDLCLTQWSPRFSRLLSEEFPQFRAFEVGLAAPSAEWDRFRV